MKIFILLSLKKLGTDRKSTRTAGLEMHRQIMWAWQQLLLLIFNTLNKFILTLRVTFFLQCFDAVGWAAGRASGL